MSQDSDSCEWEGCQNPPHKKLRFVGIVIEWVYNCNKPADPAEQFPDQNEPASLYAQFRFGSKDSGCWVGEHF